MKTFTKIGKGVSLAVFAAVVGTSMAFALSACGNNPANDDKGDNDDAIVTGGSTSQIPEGTAMKYDASLDASVPMAGGVPVSFENLLADAYVVNDDGKYELVLIFQVGEIEVMGNKGTVFVDDNPANPSTINGVKDGTIGVYKADGTLATEGVTLTYGAGYAPLAGGYASYVKSATIPVETLETSYEISFYANSAVKGAQFSKDTYSAKVELENGEEVEKISGLGNAARLADIEAVSSMSFTVSTLEESYVLAVYVNAFNTTALSGMQFPYVSEKLGTSNAVLEITEEDGGYSATLDAVVNMGASGVNFTQNLLDGIEIEENDGEYTITLNFRFGTVNMPYNNVMTGYMNAASAVDHFGNEVVPVFGYYDGETLVTEGVICK